MDNQRLDAIIYEIKLIAYIEGINNIHMPRQIKWNWIKTRLNEFKLEELSAERAYVRVRVARYLETELHSEKFI